MKLKASLAVQFSCSLLMVNATSLECNQKTPWPCQLSFKPAVMGLRQTITGVGKGNGLGMLLYQGAAAFTLWTGKEMPDVVRPLVV